MSKRATFTSAASLLALMPSIAHAQPGNHLAASLRPETRAMTTVTYSRPAASRAPASRPQSRPSAAPRGWAGQHVVSRPAAIAPNASSQGTHHNFKLPGGITLPGPKATLPHPQPPTATLGPKGLLGSRTPGASTPTPSNPFTGQSNAQVRQQEAQANADRARLQAAADKARSMGQPPAIVNSLQNQADAAAQQAANAKLELATRATVNPPVPGPLPPIVPGLPPIAPRLPPSFPMPLPAPAPGLLATPPAVPGAPAPGPTVIPPGLNAPAPGPIAGPFAPIAPAPGPVAISPPPVVGALPAPSYQPTTPQANTPICMSGAWVDQNQQRQYVCLSWYYNGQLYTPDQMQQLLAQ